MLFLSTSTAVAATVATLFSVATAHPSSTWRQEKASQKEKRITNSNLTPDAYYHNRYHAILAMAAYGDYNASCPQYTFTPEAQHRNFPNSTRPAWQVISTFGPTKSGCAGYTAIVPEMNKAVIVFRGNYDLEQTLPADVVPWSYFGVNETACPGCTANRFAAQGYMECKNQTNNWADIRAAFAGQGLVFSITGHGLGGMHALIASVDLNNQKVDYYSHNYGTPRTFNNAGANHYNANFNGEAAERGIYGNDTYVDYFPASADYAHAGTGFYYNGWDASKTGPAWTPCFSDSSNTPTGQIVDDPGCAPRAQVNSTAAQDHYFYFTNVGDCGQNIHQDTSVADAFIKNAVSQPAVPTLSSALTAPGVKTGSAANAQATKTGAASKTGTTGGVIALIVGAVALL